MRIRDFFLRKRNSSGLLFSKRIFLIGNPASFFAPACVTTRNRLMKRRARVWSRALFVSPYIVLLRQSIAAYSSPFFSCCVFLKCSQLSIVKFAVILYASCATVAALGLEVMRSRQAVAEPMQDDVRLETSGQKGWCPEDKDVVTSHP